jgi:SAM-dependent methyltransferase
MNSDQHNDSGGQQFAEQLDQRHKWLLLGAEQKAQSVIQLTAGLNVSSVFEIGCGTGALLESLDRLEFATSYYALDPSQELYRYMTDRHVISRLIASEPVTLEQCSLTDRRYDLVILSHVLEHVENPAELLSGAMQVADHVVLEVPLEGNWMGNLRAVVKARCTGLPRHNNLAGHIQYFSRADIWRLVHWCGGEIVRSRLYVPRAQMRMAKTTGSLSKRAYATLVMGLNSIFGDQLWSRFYYGHYAVLVRQRAPIADEDISLWPSTNYYIQR